MTSPSTAAATPFAPPQEDEATLLARDMALILEKLGTEQANHTTGRYAMGKGGCLVILSQLEMDKNASVPERMERRWSSARLIASMQSTPVSDAADHVPLFNAICTNREAIAGAHPVAGLEKLPFEASPLAPGQWVYAVRGLASALRQAQAVTYDEHGPSAVRRRAPAWHST